MAPLAKRKRSSAMANWSDLHPELVISIANAVVSTEDFFTFRAVSKSWRSAAPKESFNTRLTHQLPWLMLPVTDTVKYNVHRIPNEDTDIREFYNLAKDKFFKLTLPKANGKMCYYSSLGWLLTLTGDWKANLLHPLNHAQIELPGIEKLNRFPEQCLWRSYLWKFVLSSSPSWTSDYVVMLCHGLKNLAFWRPGDEQWTIMDTILETLSDLVYYKQQYYIVDVTGNVSVCNIEDPNHAHTQVVVAKMPQKFVCAPIRKIYLVESGGSLLAVSRFREVPHAPTIGFRVFEVPFSNGNWLDSEVNNLGNKTLFLGDNSSFSVDASKYPGCKANCIYFTNDLLMSYKREQEDLGIYNMEDGKIEPLLDKSPCFKTPYVWVQPSV